MSSAFFWKTSLRPAFQACPTMTPDVPSTAFSMAWSSSASIWPAVCSGGLSWRMALIAVSLAFVSRSVAVFWAIVSAMTLSELGLVDTGPDRFGSVAEVRAGLASVAYLADDGIAGVVYLADKLAKPVLVEGPAGTGKTQLAKSVAECTGKFANFPNYGGFHTIPLQPLVTPSPPVLTWP